jgi:ArsR family transcriptional regulator
MAIYSSMSTPSTGARPLPGRIFDRAARALADRRRREIVEMLASYGELPCTEICRRLPVTQATVSHHLKELSAAGLLTSRRVGQFSFYQVDQRFVRRYLSELENRLQPARGRRA